MVTQKFKVIERAVQITALPEKIKNWKAILSFILKTYITDHYPIAVSFKIDAEFDSSVVPNKLIKVIDYQRLKQLGGKHRLVGFLCC